MQSPETVTHLRVSQRTTMKNRTRERERERERERDGYEV